MAGGRRMGRHGASMATEKPKNFKSTMKKLLSYLKKYKYKI